MRSAALRCAPLRIVASLASMGGPIACLRAAALTPFVTMKLSRQPMLLTCQQDQV